MRTGVIFDTILALVLGGVIAFGCALYMKVNKMEEAFEPVPVWQGPQMSGSPEAAPQEIATQLRVKLSLEDSMKIAQLQEDVDSLFATDEVFAKSILYLDSCNQSKLTKTERAERRGRFVGGLLRGLFPNLPGK
jgi:hypothetical protein